MEPLEFIDFEALPDFMKPKVDLDIPKKVSITYMEDEDDGSNPYVPLTHHQ